MDNRILYFSYDKEIKLSDLKKKSDFGDFDGTSIYNRMTKNQVNGLIADDQNFHFKLSSIKHKPYIVYYMGNIDLLHKPILGIVGPRRNTEYAHKVVDKLLKSASEYDLVTISGLATGVDQICHRGSIKNNIPTIAVLGGGISHYLKGPNHKLIKQIIDHGGLILSEYRLGQEPNTFTFPQRNRIIAGLCDMLFLPEASLKSGSLITVDFAIKHRKPVYGVPNNMFAIESQGIHGLISDGTIKMCNDFGLMLNKHFKLKSGDMKIENKNYSDYNLSIDEKLVLDIISSQADTSISLLQQKLDKSTQATLSILTILEINGLICQSISGIYNLT